MWIVVCFLHDNLGFFGLSGWLVWGFLWVFFFFFFLVAKLGLCCGPRAL